MTEIEPPKNERVTKQGVRPSDLVDNETDQVRNHVTKLVTKSSNQMIKSSDQVTDSAAGKNVGNDVGNVVGAKALSATERAVFDAIQANSVATEKPALQTWGADMVLVLSTTCSPAPQPRLLTVARISFEDPRRPGIHPQGSRRR